MDISSDLFEWISKVKGEAFSYQKLITNENGEVIDCLFLYVNEGFAKITGRTREEIIGKRATEVFPKIVQYEGKQWLADYAVFVHECGEMCIEQYFEPAGSRFSVYAYSNEKQHFFAVFNRIVAETDLWDKQAEAEILAILAESNELSWALQMVLLKILEKSGFTLGAIRLVNKLNFFYGEYQGIEELFFKSDIIVNDDGTFYLSNGKSEHRKECFLNHLAEKGSPAVQKTEQGSLFVANAANLFEDIPDKDSENGFLCRQCIRRKKNDYRTILAIPLKTLEETVGVFYLSHNYPGIIDFKRIAYLESLVRPVAYSVMYLQHQEYIKNSEKRFRLLVQNARDVIFRFVLNPDIKCDYISPVIEQMTGYSPALFMADYRLFIDIVHQEDRHLAGKLFSAPENSSEIEDSITLRWVCSDNRTIWVEIQAHTNKEGNGIYAVEGIIRDVTERVETEKRIRANNETINSLSVKLLNAYEQERARVARELHDEVGQALTAAKLELQMLGPLIKKDAPSLVENLDRSIDVINDTIINVRKQVVFLRPPVLEQFPLTDLIRDMVKESAMRSRFRHRVIIEGDFTGKLSRDLEVALYRCAQESLTNIMRHARATNVRVRLKCEDNSVYFFIKDNGRGFDTNLTDNQREHVGLTGMRERVTLLGGTFYIGSASGTGTEISISIPIKRNQRGVKDENTYCR